MGKLRRTDDLEFQVVTFRSSVAGVYLGRSIFHADTVR